MSGDTRTCTEIHGHVRRYTGMYGDTRTCTEIHGDVRRYTDMSGDTRTCTEIQARIQGWGTYGPLYIDKKGENKGAHPARDHHAPLFQIPGPAPEMYGPKRVGPYTDRPYMRRYIRIYRPIIM